MASTTTTPASRRPSGVRTDRDRLRDYYGLGAGSGSGTADTSAIPADAKKAEVSTTQNTPAATRAEDLKEVLRNESIQGLLKKHSDLQTEIRELDGERQSLVYNHHTDLVAASETIRKMKTQADDLTPTLGSLRGSFDSMSRLQSQLDTALTSAKAEAEKSRDDDGINRLEGTQAKMARDLVVPIVTLPQRLRDVIALGGADSRASDSGSEQAQVQSQSQTSEGSQERGLAAAEALWGRHESVLSTWASEGIRGADAVAAECRMVLREQRERVAASASPVRSAKDLEGVGS